MRVREGGGGKEVLSPPPSLTRMRTRNNTAGWLACAICICERETNDRAGVGLLDRIKYLGSYRRCSADQINFYQRIHYLKRNKIMDSGKVCIYEIRARNIQEPDTVLILC